VGLAILAFAGAAVADEDNGPALVDLFAKTCARRPALPSDIARLATGLGFVGDGTVTAEMERGPQIDILYIARLAKAERNVSMTAYFAGPVEGPTVICTLSTAGVSAEALPRPIETSLNARDRTETAGTDTNQRKASWHVGAAGDGDTLDLSAWRTSPQRASVTITYRGAKR